jgi:hypothetical protein
MQRNVHSYRVALPLAVALLAGADIARAETISYGSYSVINEQNISIYTPSSVTGGAGQIVLNGSGANAGQNFLAWCLDIYTFLANTGTYGLSSLTTAGSGGSNPSLTTTQIGEIGALMLNGDRLINASRDVSAATQLAIWKVEYGASFSSDGISPSVTSLAQTYINQAGPGGTLGPVPVTLLSQPGNQHLGGVATTPLPSTWTMLLGGLAGILFLAFPRRRAAPPLLLS